MKILLIVPYVPNLIRVRSFQLINALMQRGHHITLATLWSNEAERADLAPLTALGVRVLAQPMPAWRALVNTLRSVPTSSPLQAVYSWQPALAHKINELLQSELFDVVHVEHLRGARYGLAAQTVIQRLAKPIPVVWDSVDCISHLFQQAAQASRSHQARLLTKLDLPRTRRYEGHLVRQFDQVLVTSPTDRTALLHLASVEDDRDDIGRHVHVLPNGVDLAYFSPNGAAREPATIVFSGKMSYHANITAALHLVNDIMPRVWRHRPQTKVWIVGKDPSSAVQALAATAGKNVVVTGTVADLRPYLQAATVAVAPIPYGAGIQNKVLEAMACAAPVVASPQASSALQARNEHDLLITAYPEQFAAHILHLLDNPGQCNDLGRAGRAYVERCHSWQTVAAQLENIYAAAVAEKRRDLLCV